MLKRLFPITLMMCFAVAGFSQTPNPAKTSPVDPNAPESVVVCTGTQDAGTITLGPFTGSSSDIDLNTMYLCFNDQVEILHNGDFDLSGDPDPSTQGGIGYAFYSCLPTVTGEELSDITLNNGEPCLLQDEVFNFPPFPMIGPDSIWIAASASNDLTIINTGALQTGFNAGAPIQLWFAPITYDNLIGGAVAEYEGTPSGACVNARVDEAFSVVYLNEIQESNIQTSTMVNGNVSTCQGSFLIEGGLPEFDAAENYNISITLSTDPNISALVTSGNAPHGETVEFNVTTPGVYDVVISDGKACPASFTIDMSGCQSLGMIVGNETATTGSQICVPVTVENFTDIQSFQYTMVFNDAIIEYASVDYTNTNSIDLIAFQIASDTLTFSFFYSSGGAGSLTIPDGTTLFEVCFNVLGPVGSSSSVEINGEATIIDVFDLNGIPLGLAVTNGSVTVVNQGAFDIDVVGQDVNCSGGMDGSFTATVNGAGGGTAPYDIAWAEVGNAANNGAINAIPANGMVTQPGLSAGTYALVITDSSNPAMTELDTVEINQPPILGASISETQPILCFGDTNGSFTANVIVGGVVLNNPGPEYSFEWSPGPVFTQTIDNVNPALGTYAVTITDGNNCTAVASTTPSQPSQLTVGLDVTDAACSGINNGQIEALSNGGVVALGYDYAWSTAPIQNAQTATNLAIGTYTVTVTDDNNCTATASAPVLANTIIYSGATISNVTCNGNDDGAIFFNPQVTGIDNGGYTYQWDPLVSAGSNASPLSPDSYDVTITDALGCNIDTTIIITEPDVIQFVGGISTTDETCTVGNDGTATVTIAGGTPSVIDGYSFTWSCCPSETSNTATGISSGVYTVSVMDSLGCTTIDNFTINPPTPPTIVSFDSISVNCPTDTNGELTVNATMGNAMITSYNWTFPGGSSGTGQTISNLSAGTYTVTVTASDGCTATDMATLYAPQQLVLVQPLPTNPTCFGETTGTASVQMSGGTMPYQYLWSSNANSSTNSTVPGLGAGTYTVTVTDANNCDQVVTEVVLQNPPVITIEVIDSSPVSCDGAVAPDCDGMVEVLASGGNAPTAMYTFSWSSNEMTMGMNGIANELCQGMQMVTVTDENNCFSIDTIEVLAQPALGVTTTLTQPLCNGESNGSIEVMGTGGTPGYTYAWVGGNTGPVLNNLPAGFYNLTITDFNGCEFTTIIELDEPPALEVTLDQLNTNDVGCNGENNGQIALIVDGGTGTPGDMTFNWAGGIAADDSNIASGLSPGAYSVTVTDLNGCTEVLQHTISEPLPVFANIPPPIEPTCNGDQTLFTVESAFGGSGEPYLFSIDGGPLQNIGNVISIFAGEHEIVVQDSLGCTYSETIFINQPPALEVNLGPDIEIQLGESAQLNAVLTGSTVPIDSIVWTPQMFDSLSCTGCLSPLVTPTDDVFYTVEIFDINGCFGSDDILVEVDKNRNVFIPNVFTPNGDGYNDIFQVFSGPGVEEINSIRIFDRWGELVFNVEDLLPTADLDYDNGWDGSLKGKVMNPGVFVYIIEVTFEDGISLLYRGDLTLLH